MVGLIHPDPDSISSLFVIVDLTDISIVFRYLSFISYATGGWIMWDYGKINPSWASIPAKWFWLDGETGKF